MNKHAAETENGSAVWFTSSLFDRKQDKIPGFLPQPVENSVDNPVFSCGKVCGKPLDSVDNKTGSAEKPRLCHGFSTRHGGISRDPYLTDLNFGFSCGEDRETTLENYRIMERRLGIGAGYTVCAYQTHTCNVLTVGKEHRGLGLDPAVKQPFDVFPDGYDALVTREPGVALAVRTADCVPILFWDPEHDVIGAAHAGWKGTYGRIAEKTLTAMEAIGADRRDILVCIGHAVGMCCYEIDDGFYGRFLEAFGEDVCGRVFAKEPHFEHPERYHCDLRALNGIILEAAGVPKAHIEISQLCTCCHPELFYSHRYAVRYQGGKRGLLAAMISME